MSERGWSGRSGTPGRVVRGADSPRNAEGTPFPLSVRAVWGNCDGNVVGNIPKKERQTMAGKKTEGEATPRNQGGEAGGKEKVSKIDAVRRTMEKVGYDVKPKELQARVVEEFGPEYDMSVDHVKTARNNVLKKAGVPSTPRGRKPKAKAKVKAKKAALKPARHKEEASPREQPAPVAPSNGKDWANNTQDIVTLRDLVDRVGADHLKTLIDVLVR